MTACEKFQNVRFPFPSEPKMTVFKQRIQNMLDRDPNVCMDDLFSPQHTFESCLKGGSNKLRCISFRIDPERSEVSGRNNHSMVREQTEIMHLWRCQTVAWCRRYQWRSGDGWVVYVLQGVSEHQSSTLSIQKWIKSWMNRLTEKFRNMATSKQRASQTCISSSPVTLMTGRKPVLSNEELTQIWRDKDKETKQFQHF